MNVADWLALEAMRSRGLLVEVDGEWYATRRGQALDGAEERRERIQRAAARRWSGERRSKYMHVFKGARK